MQHRRGLQKYAAGYCNFLTDSSKFTTQTIISAQNLNFAPDSPKMAVFSPKFGILEERFPTKQAG